MNIRDLFKEKITLPKDDERQLPRPGEVVPFDPYPQQSFPTRPIKLKRKATLVLRSEQVQELYALLNFVIRNTENETQINSVVRFQKMLLPRIREKKAIKKAKKKHE